MVSVVMPYWRRREVLKANLENYRALYPGGEPIEIIIVDDGSPEPTEIADDYPWPVRVIRLPKKDTALNPCVPLNIGVANANGDVIVITNPEVMHRTPILGPLRAELESLGPQGYVAAACWGGWWYCHSYQMPPHHLVGRAKMPEGAGLHFCSVLYRGLFDAIGGFTEAYRAGQGYEDNDFLWKLHKAGARFKICDHLVCDHVPCPRSEWPSEGAKRNKQLFDQTWRDYA